MSWTVKGKNIWLGEEEGGSYQARNSSAAAPLSSSQTFYLSVCHVPGIWFTCVLSLSPHSSNSVKWAQLVPFCKEKVDGSLGEPSRGPVCLKQTVHVEMRQIGGEEADSQRP